MRRCLYTGLGRLIVAVLALAFIATPVAATGAWGRVAGAAAAVAADGAGEGAPGAQIPLRLAPEGVQTLVPPPAATGGARAQSATIAVTYIGFSAEARAAFQRAVDIWAAQLTSPVAIAVTAEWQPLGSGILGSAGPTVVRRNFSGAPLAGVWYPAALANKLAGADLDPGQADIDAYFSSAIGSWYFGTGQTPANRINFTSVVLHELGHGLGFVGTGDVAGGVGSWGLGTGAPTIFDRGVVNGSGQGLLNTALFPNPSVALAAQLTSRNLFFSGANARAANGGTAPRLYAPSSWSPGSSLSHLDEATYPAGNPNALMTPALAPGESIYDPGPLARGILQDLGWSVEAPASPSPSPSPSPAATLTLRASGGGTIGAAPILAGYTPGQPVTLSPVANPGYRFIGWTVDGQFRGWAAPLSLTMNTSHVVEAAFSLGVPFADVPGGQPSSGPIAELAARGFIQGYGDGTFGPADRTMRAQMAALIARAMAYTDNPANPFTDRCNPGDPGDCVDAELWTRVAQLAGRDIARGYTDAATCAPAAAPCYAPRDEVLHAQVLSFITRAMIDAGYWQRQPIDPTLFGGVLNGSGHEQDAATYAYYTQGRGGVPGYPPGGPFAAWNRPATRGWFAQALWVALDSYWGSDQPGAGGYLP